VGKFKKILKRHLVEKGEFNGCRIESAGLSVDLHGDRLPGDHLRRPTLSDASPVTTGLKRYHPLGSNTHKITKRSIVFRDEKF
jgi:hypothetical protein